MVDSVIFQTISTKSTVVLKQRLSKVFFIGGITENFEFKTDDDTQVLRSCSALLNGELFVFGGYNFRRQVVTLST